MTTPPIIALSLTDEELHRLSKDGPRRDIVLLAQRLGATMLLRRMTGSRSGLRGKVFGPHVRHAWKAAKAHPRPRIVFADGEHVGIPLAIALAARGRRSTRLLILGHFVDKRWKMALLWLATRLTPEGTLILHSNSQAARVKRVLSRGWEAVVLPYQVDTEFWRAEGCATVRDRVPLIVSAGSENRDYQTLVEAVRGLDVRVRIAAGSHWARTNATASELPANVEFIRETLSFMELRALYAEADVVVVPLLEGTNQAGVTTILEAMSMARPVVVSATEGQREVVTGPFVTSAGEAPDLTADRGPHRFGLDANGEDSGLYVPPGDAGALRAAIIRLLAEPERAARMAASAREEAVSHFRVEQFADRFAELFERERPTTHDSPEPVPA
jgi:glycosyltransferase involved in cell wall biosynthesis